MELIHADSLPESIQQLTRTNPKSEQDVKVSLYVPNYLSGRSRIWKQSRRLLSIAEKFMSMGLSQEETRRRLAVVEEKIFLEQSQSNAQGFAYFLDGERCEAQPLVVRPEPLAVVSDTFHIKPLLQSLAREPHHRLVIVQEHEAQVYARDHDSLRMEWSMEFPQEEPPPTSVLHPKETPEELNRVWHNVEDFAKKLLQSQMKDPRPLALFGNDRLRRLLIEDIRSELTRPIFVQGQVKGTLRSLCVEADRAYTDRLSDDTPYDVNEVMSQAREQGLLLSNLKEIFREALAGNVESLLVTRDNPAWGLVNSDSGEVEFHTHQQDHHDDCVVDDTIEQVIKHGGNVLFASPSQVESKSRSGLFAIKRLEGQGKPAL